MTEHAYPPSRGSAHTAAEPREGRPSLDAELASITRCVNPATGPIAIEGVVAGDTICVEIEELHVDSRLGLMVTRPGVTGLVITDEPQLRIVTCDDSYATVGAFGFEGRWDYTAIGGVVNLADRLCREAKPGQILIDRRARAALAEDFRVQPIGPISLKGYLQPVAAFALTA